MYRDRKIGLIIPAHNEERLIVPTLKNVPEYFDHIIVIEDKSTDSTKELVEEYAKKDTRVNLILHDENRGVGAGVITGLETILKLNVEVILAVGGDNQMDLSEAKKFLDPLIEGRADYVKGNRFMSKGNALRDMPKQRLIGNISLSFLTMFFSGYWGIFDTQDGYIGFTRELAQTTDWNPYWKGYGFVSDFIIRFSGEKRRIMDVPRRAVYLEGEKQSQINVRKYFLMIYFVMIRAFLYRIKKRYFSPLSIGGAILASGILTFILSIISPKSDFINIYLSYIFFGVFLLYDMIINLRNQPKWEKYYKLNDY